MTRATEKTAAMQIALRNESASAARMGLPPAS